MNKIFNELIMSKIIQFENNFSNLSRQIFVDEDGKLRHAGEFGTYREKIVLEFLEPFLPTRLSVGSGFVITDKNKISTQCDIIIYDRENTPLIENCEQRFFPIESVVGVIEVKSALSKSDLKNALIKLSKIKELRKDITDKPFVYKDPACDKNYIFDPINHIYDQIATFIICEKFEFDIEKHINTFFQETYKGIDKSIYHNMILSLDKYCCLYNSNEKRPIYSAYSDYKKELFKNELILPHELYSNKEHIVTFLNYFYMLISSISVLDIDITRYLGQKRFNKTIVET